MENQKEPHHQEQQHQGQQHQGQHRMGRRSLINNYHHSGTYHITLRTNALFHQPLGQITGDLAKPDGDPSAPHTALSSIGQMVEEELLTSITAHYPMVEILEHVIMPEHLHFILVVWKPLVSANGRDTHLGQVIAGFKKGCNRRFWEIAGIPAPTAAIAGQGGSLPSKATTGRPPLFEYGYVDVMPLRKGQLEQQREYIRHNPRSRLLRMQTTLMQPQRGGIDTALTPSALKGYLKRECHPSLFDDAIWQDLQARLLIVTPWQYHYRHADDQITVSYCKTMNCLVQALCRQKDDWWKQ